MNNKAICVYEKHKEREKKKEENYNKPNGHAFFPNYIIIENFLVRVAIFLSFMHTAMCNSENQWIDDIIILGLAVLSPVTIIQSLCMKPTSCTVL